jgi:hypothetical protein
MCSFRRPSAKGSAQRSYRLCWVVINRNLINAFARQATSLGLQCRQAFQEDEARSRNEGEENCSVSSVSWKLKYYIRLLFDSKRNVIVNSPQVHHAIFHQPLHRLTCFSMPNDTDRQAILNILRLHILHLKSVSNVQVIYHIVRVSLQLFGALDNWDEEWEQAFMMLLVAELHMIACFEGLVERIHARRYIVSRKFWRGLQEDRVMVIERLFRQNDKFFKHMVRCVSTFLTILYSITTDPSNLLHGLGSDGSAAVQGRVSRDMGQPCIPQRVK